MGNNTSKNKMPYKANMDVIMRSYLKTDKNGTKRYKNKAGKLHRENGPAVEYANGDKEYWINGQHHREDGPAIECINGNKAYWINGRFLTPEQFKKYKLKERLKELI